MTYDEWRETYFPGPLMNEAMARAAWSAAKAIEREACAQICNAASEPRKGYGQTDEQWAASTLAERIRARGTQ